MQNIDIVLLGGGMVGLSLVHQIILRFPELLITVIDKEAKLGRHSSGTNSGVFHVGVYPLPPPPPGPLIGSSVLAGSERLRSWFEYEGLPVFVCGKVIAPQRIELDSQLDPFLERGLANGANVEMMREDEFRKLVRVEVLSGAQTYALSIISLCCNAWRKGHRKRA